MEYEEVSEDYFDLDTILATNSSITCVFDKNTPLGWLYFIKLKKIKNYFFGKF